MAEKGPMARMQLLLPSDLKGEIEQFAEEQGLSANEAIRVLSRRGLNASGKAPPVSNLGGGTGLPDSRPGAAAGQARIGRALDAIFSHAKIAVL